MARRFSERSRLVGEERRLALQLARRNYTAQYASSTSGAFITPPGCIRGYRWVRGVREHRRPVMYTVNGHLSDGVLESINLRTVKFAEGGDIKFLIALIRCSDGFLLGVPSSAVWCKAAVFQGPHVNAHLTNTPMPKVPVPDDEADIPKHVFDFMPIDDWGNWATGN